MQYIKLKDQLKNYTLFSLVDIRKIDENFGRARLNEWQNKGYIKKIIKNYYIFTDISLNESRIYEIANKIYSPSYISLEMALSYYNLIPEGVYDITSVTTRRTYTFNTEIGLFLYRRLKPSLFFGFNLVEYNGKYYKIASIEKTILDFLYFNSKINTITAMESLRFNLNEFLQVVNEGKFSKFVDIFNNKELSKRVKVFWEFINNARS